MDFFPGVMLVILVLFFIAVAYILWRTWRSGSNRP